MIRLIFIAFSLLTFSVSFRYFLGGCFRPVARLRLAVFLVRTYVICYGWSLDRIITTPRRRVFCGCRPTPGSIGSLFPARRPVTLPCCAKPALPKTGTTLAPGSAWQSLRLRWSRSWLAPAEPAAETTPAREVPRIGTSRVATRWLAHLAQRLEGRLGGLLKRARRNSTQLENHLSGSYVGCLDNNRLV